MKQMLIVPGESIGDVKLGMTEQDVCAVLPKPCERVVKPSGVTLLRSDDMKIWLDKEGKVFQISCTSPRARTRKQIGVGCQFAAIADPGRFVYDEDGYYLSLAYPGLLVTVDARGFVDEVFVTHRS